tara:strand:- start:410 stop:604 length:195 start_codon:yes stop_codon:yes gene_type:complete
MERGLVMVVHAVVFGLFSYVIMLYGLKQSQSMAENRSVLAGAVVLAYMVVFGHELPSMKSLKRL